MSQDCPNETIIVENQDEIIWSDAAEEIVMGNSQEKNEIIIVDAHTNVTQEFPTTEVILEGEQNTTEFDRIPNITFNISTTAPQTQTVILVSLPKNTWTDFPPSFLISVVDFKIYDEDGDEITESFEYRRSGNSYQVYSLSTYSNLTIELEG